MLACISIPAQKRTGQPARGGLGLQRGAGPKRPGRVGAARMSGPRAQGLGSVPPGGALAWSSRGTLGTRPAAVAVQSNDMFQQERTTKGREGDASAAGRARVFGRCARCPARRIIRGPGRKSSPDTFLVHFIGRGNGYCEPRPPPSSSPPPPKQSKRRGRKEGGGGGGRGKRGGNKKLIKGKESEGGSR